MTSTLINFTMTMMSLLQNNASFINMTLLSCAEGQTLSQDGLRCEKAKYQDFYDVTQMITGLVLYPTTCALGMVGNLLCLIVFSRRNMRTSTNIYLQALAVADMIKLFTDFLYFIVVLLLRVEQREGIKLHGYLYPYAHYLFNMSLCISAWLTVCVSVERFIFICQPSRVKRFCTVSRAIKVSTSTFILGIAVSFPYMLRYRTNSAVVNGTIEVYGVNVTALWSKDLFATAYTWAHALLRSAIPLLLLACLNISIWRGLKRPSSIQKNARLKYKATLTLIYVVVVFFVCVTPDAILSTVLGFGYYEENNFARGIREISDYLLQVNSAVNFVIYYFSCTAFRNSISSMCTRGYAYEPTRQSPIINENTCSQLASSTRHLDLSYRTSNGAANHHGFTFAIDERL